MQGDFTGALASYRDSFAIRDRLAKSDRGNAWGAAVIWCGREDAVRGRLTHHQNPHTRFRAF